MNLQQFRFVQEAVRRNLNLTDTAKALATSQPGVSKAILEFEEELGVDIFARHGKRLKRITEPGQAVLRSIDIIMREVVNLRRIGETFSKQDSGTLTVAATHMPARYLLPDALTALRQRYPKVQLVLHQAQPGEVARMLLDDAAEIGLTCESLARHDGLVTLPCLEWQHVLVVPAGHALAGTERVTLEQLAEHPLALYSPATGGRTRIDQAFELARLHARVALETVDSELLKAYVRLGLGAGVVSELAMRAEPAGAGVVVRPLGHLFGPGLVRLAFKRGAYLRPFVHALAEMLAPHLSAALFERALAGQGSDCQL
jgi:LysR family cys regulon transcriptional activator